VQQSHILGIPGITTATIGATTSCDRGGPKVKDEGAGPNWICMMSWTDNHGQHQDGKFEVTVKTDATYVAGGPSKIVGLATITGATSSSSNAAAHSSTKPEKLRADSDSPMASRGHA
jgi:hypothetical protein